MLNINHYTCSVNRSSMHFNLRYQKCNAYSIQLFTQLLKSGTVSQTMLLEQFLIWGSSLLKAVCIGFFWKLVNHNLSVSSSPIYNNNFTELQWTICLAFWILGVLVGYCSHNACYIQKITYWRTKLYLNTFHNGSNSNERDYVNYGTNSYESILSIHLKSYNISL